MRLRPTLHASPRALAPVLACALLGLSGLAVAQPGGRKEEAPKELDGVGIEEKLGAKLPLQLEFTDSDGKQVALGELFRGERPVLLTMNYSDCPMLCSLQLNGLVDALNTIEWQIGKEFDIVTISLDPKEAPERAKQTKDRYLTQYAKGDKLAAARGWTFLVGSEANIKAVADTVGFGYRYSEERQEYLHQAGIMVLSPSATMSRYLYGIAFSPQTVRLSMAEASEGKQVSTVDALVLYCFHYDAEAGNYTPAVRNIMKLGGAITVVALAFFVAAGITVKKHRKKVANTPANGVA